MSISFEGHKNCVLRVAFSPDGTMIASSSYDNTIKLWNLEGRVLKTFEGHEDWVNSVSFSPDGTMIASGSNDKTIRLWTI